MHKKLLKNTLAAILLFIPICSFGQADVRELNKRAKDLFEKGMYKEAQNAYWQILKDKLENTVKYPDIHSTINGYAIVCHKNGIYDEAEQYFEAAYDIRKKIFGNTSLEYAETVNDMGKLYLEMGKMRKLILFLMRHTILGSRNSELSILIISRP